MGIPRVRWSTADRDYAFPQSSAAIEVALRRAFDRGLALRAETEERESGPKQP